MTEKVVPFKVVKKPAEEEADVKAILAKAVEQELDAITIIGWYKKKDGEADTFYYASSQTGDLTLYLLEVVKHSILQDSIPDDNS